MNDGNLGTGKIILIAICTLLVILGITWIAQGNDFFMYKVFAPKYEATRREVFKQSQAYNDGMATELESMQVDYMKAQPENKAALASIILHRVSNYDQTKLPVDLRNFIDGLKRDQMSPSTGPAEKNYR